MLTFRQRLGANRLIRNLFGCLLVRGAMKTTRAKKLSPDKKGNGDPTRRVTSAKSTILVVDSLYVIV